MNLFISLSRPVLLFFLFFAVNTQANQQSKEDDKVYFSYDGVDVLVFNNAPGGLFFDAKTSGIEIIQHGERTATNGDVRLQHVPEQWDGMAQLVKREVNTKQGSITTTLAYPEHDFEYQVQATQKGKKIIIKVLLDKPLPKKLAGHAGFNMEFLPAVYWDKHFLVDNQPGQFSRTPTSQGGMEFNSKQLTQPSALAVGQHMVLAPESDKQRVSIKVKKGGKLHLFDGRTKAQNGWYVVRSLIPENKKGAVVEWELEAHGQDNWLRSPVVAFSQIGYHPKQLKIATVELDKKDKPLNKISLHKINADGTDKEVLTEQTKTWGQYLRYNYLTFDFSEIKQPGLYFIQYGDIKTNAFPIDDAVHEKNWQATLDYFFPIQMDHMRVKEAYRAWHGVSHMDDALQAPPSYEHFDLYAHDENLDTNFKSFEHIPGLNYGGWYDAGDFDIRTQSQYKAVEALVDVYEEFNVQRDNTTVLQDKKFAQINRPDGKQDLLQQIEHGSLALIAQHRAIGHAIPGIVAGRLYQYPFLGDGGSKTDNKIYDAKLDKHASKRSVGKMYEPSTVDPTPYEDSVSSEDGLRSGVFDDRWAFTSNVSALNFGSAAALAATSRALKDYDKNYAAECLATAEKVWLYEKNRTPNTYKFGNTTGGKLEEEKFRAAAELLKTTQKDIYKQGIKQLLPEVLYSTRANHIAAMVKAIPFMDEDYKDQLRKAAKKFVEKTKEYDDDNPFGVPISRYGWAGNSGVLDFGIAYYWFNKAFPDLVDDSRIDRALNYILGTHPDSNYSFVSGVGAHSQTKAYGTNRADFSFIPGGVVPGVLVLNPDYPENKSDWPFFWGQNEYVIPEGARYLFLNHAAQARLR